MIMEHFGTQKQPQGSNQLNFASLHPKNSTQNSQPKLEDSSSQMKEEHPLLQFQKEFPLRGLTVYVEILSNGTNISETCYSYLEKLGAKVEKRMNKKCNLIIWKDGPLKTIEKAKEYGVTVVNSLWLEDCIENFHCASFDKFAPSLPNEADLPFITVQNNKKKRKAADPMAFDTQTKDSPSKASVQRKKRKTTDKEPGSDIKVNIQLGSQKKLNDFFGNKQNKPVITSFGSLNLDEGPNNFNTAFNQANNNRRFTFSHKIEYNCLESIQINEVEFGTSQKSLENSFSTDSRQQSIQKSLPPTRILASVTVTQNNSEKKELGNLSKVKNMILSYAKTEVGNTTEKKQPMKPETKSLELKDMSSNSRSGSRFLKENRLSTSSLSRSRDRSADNSKMKTIPKNIIQTKKEEENGSGLEKILFKYFPDNESKAKKVPGLKDSQNKPNPEKMITEDVDKKSKNTKIPVKKESKFKENKRTQEERLSSSMQSEEDSSNIKTDSNASEFKQPTGSMSAQGKKASSLPKNNIIQKYTEKEKPCYWNEILNICGESREESQRAFTRSQSKKKIGSENSQSRGSDIRDIENKLKFESLQKSDVPSTSRKTKSLAPKKETKETRTSLVCKNLFDLGFKKTNANTNRDKSAGAQLKSDRNKSESELDDSTLRDSIYSDEGKISRKKNYKPAANGIIFTNMSGPTLEKPKEFCEKFNYDFLEDELTNVPTLEWLVYQGVQGLQCQNSQGTQESQLPRNFRVAFAMARGKPVIRKEWIDNSLKEEKVQDCEEYKFKYNHPVRKSLFAKMRFYIDKEFESLPHNVIGKRDLTALITAAEGSIFDNVRACDFCVVRKAPKKKISVPAHVKVITIQWIIDSIIEGKFMNTQHVNYTVF